MLFRSCQRFRAWAALPALAIIVLASPALSQGETAENSGLSPKIAAAEQSLLAAPGAASLWALRSILAGEPSYDPYSSDLGQLERLVRAEKCADALALYRKSQTNLALSPRAHRLAAMAAAKSGNKGQAEAESRLEASCLKALMDTGDGSQARPLLIARLSDEADILETEFGTQVESQALLFQGDKRLDQVQGADGRSYWFDVSMPCNRPVPTPVAAQSPAAATPGGAVAGGAKGESQANGRGATPAAPALPAVQDPAAKAAVQKGLDAYRAGRYDEALAAMDKAVSIEPHSAAIRVDRGNIRYARREYAQAVVDFSEAIRREPGYATAYSNRAFALTSLEEQEQAITDFNAAIRLQANYGRAYNGRGRAFLAKGMLDTAIADFDEAIRLNPAYAAAYENRSLAYAKKGDKALADADAAKARQLRGSKPTGGEKTASN